MTSPSRHSSTSATPTAHAPRPSSSRRVRTPMAFEAQLVSPERMLYTGEATQVLCRTIGGGDIAFLSDHAPLIGALDTWSVKITTTDQGERWFAVHGGFV